MTIAIDTETTGLFPHKGCQAFIITATCDQAKNYLWQFPVDPITRQVQYNDLLDDLFATIKEHDSLVFHNANFDLQVLANLGLDTNKLFDRHDIHDTIIMSHAYQSDAPHALKKQAVIHLHFPDDDEKRLALATQSAQLQAKKLGWTISSKNNPHDSLKGTQRQWYAADYWIPQQIANILNYPEDHPWHTTCVEYALKDTMRTLGLYDFFQEEMADDQRKAYDKARKLILPIIRMQNERVPLLKDELLAAKKHYSDRKAISKLYLARMIGNKEFNPDSPKQLREVLFDHYKFKPVEHGAEGPSTNKNTIITLLKSCPPSRLPEKYKFLIELKKLRNHKSTLSYLNNYYTHATPEWELQPNYKQTATGTNRLSAENPNTTNVAKKDSNNPFSGEKGIEHIAHLFDETSFKIRQVFGPKQGSHWVCIDYQQFQLLIFAVVSNSKPLLEAFANGEDVHQKVAEVLFKKSKISALERTAAKAINFGLLFGAGPAKIEKLARMPGLYNLFLDNFPNAKKYLNQQSNQAKKYGYVYTLGGYRLYVPKDIPYAASCYVIQGTEAEIVRAAMVSTSNYTYSTPDCPYRMIMMVHDELIFKTNKHSHKHLYKIMKLMEDEGKKLGVPVKVDADIVTNNWASKQSYIGPCTKCKGPIVEDQGCLSC